MPQKSYLFNWNIQMLHYIKRRKGITTVSKHNYNLECNQSLSSYKQLAHVDMCTISIWRKRNEVICIILEIIFIFMCWCHEIMKFQWQFMNDLCFMNILDSGVSQSFKLSSIDSIIMYEYFVIKQYSKNTKSGFQKQNYL